MYLFNYFLCKFHSNFVSFKDYLFENLFFFVEELRSSILPYSISLCNVADLPHQYTVQRRLDREGGKKIQSLEDYELKSYILSKLITRKKPLELLQYVAAIPMYYKR